MRASTVIPSALVAAICAGGAATAFAQTGAYWDAPGSGAVWRSGSGLCWRSGDWVRAKAIAACDPDLVAKPKPVPRPVAAPTPAPPPAVTPPPAPVAAPAPAPVPRAITLQADQLFAFNKSILTDNAKAELDAQVVAKLGDMSHIQSVVIDGFTDRLGAARYNQKLSERRAESVRAYLVSRGLDGSKIVARGFGETRPVKDCRGTKGRKALIACLAPNRRVEIRVKGVSSR